MWFSWNSHILDDVLAVFGCRARNNQPIPCFRLSNIICSFAKQSNGSSVLSSLCWNHISFGTYSNFPASQCGQVRGNIRLGVCISNELTRFIFNSIHRPRSRYLLFTGGKCTRFLVMIYIACTFSYLRMSSVEID